MKIGHIGITWGIPGDVEHAYRDTAELGYQGFGDFRGEDSRNQWEQAGRIS